MSRCNEDCQHTRRLLSTSGGLHFYGGCLQEDIREHLVCMDCGCRLPRLARDCLPPRIRWVGRVMPKQGRDCFDPQIGSRNDRMKGK